MVLVAALIRGAYLVAAAAAAGAAPTAATPLEIFLVPHTHCDAGWLWTLRSYYASVHGRPSGEDTTHAAVRDTLTTLVRALAADPALRFSWAEVVFFEMWWREQGAAVRATTKRLVAAGQLAFVGGGWVQADEVLTTYADQARPPARPPAQQQGLGREQAHCAMQLRQAEPRRVTMTPSRARRRLGARALTRAGWTRRAGRCGRRRWGTSGCARRSARRRGCAAGGGLRTIGRAARGLTPHFNGAGARRLAARHVHRLLPRHPAPLGHGAAPRMD
jgi:hypothetical protein